MRNIFSAAVLVALTAAPAQAIVVTDFSSSSRTSEVTAVTETDTLLERDFLLGASDNVVTLTREAGDAD